MIITIIILVALLFLIAVVSGIRFIYLFALPKNTMQTIQSDIKTKAIDIFVYLGIAISLIVSVTNLLQVVFAAIDRRFIDVLSATYMDPTGSDVRFAIASLIVMYPIYVGLSWYVSKDITKFLYKQNIPVRKIMIYCTIFVAVLALIGTLVSVIYTYLGGELSIRFAYKAGSVFVVALSLFAYYYYALRRDYSKKTIVPVIVTLIASVVVILAIAWSISVVGSPSVMRAKKIDSTRLSDISRIQQEIFNRVQMTDKLPATLVELDNAFQGYKVPVDPITQKDYGYTITQQPVIKMNYQTNRKELTKSAIFELCATFDTVREIDSRGQSALVKVADTSIDSFYSAGNYYYEGDASPFWNHTTGTVCFKRIISADMYYGGK